MLFDGDDLLRLDETGELLILRLPHFSGLLLNHCSYSDGRIIYLRLEGGRGGGGCVWYPLGVRSGDLRREAFTDAAAISMQISVLQHRTDHPFHRDIS